MNNTVNILLVDDEPRNLIALETMLQVEGYRLVKAESADEALKALVSAEFAAIVLDVRMPGTSGLELAQMIKQRKKTQSIPIIFLSAYYQEDEHAMQGYHVGAVDYLNKPCNPAILRSKVAVFVDLYRKSRALEAEIAERRDGEQRIRELSDQLLRQKKSELAESQRIARLGSWYWDAATDFTTGSDELYRIYGLESSEQALPSFAEQRKFFYSEADWQRLHEAMQETLRTGQAYQLDLPAARRGVAIWVTARGEAVRAAEGNIIGLRGTVQDVTDRKRTEEDLKAARTAAEAASEAKSQFLANISHELRTPMNAILGMIDVALPKAGDAVVQDCLQTARGSADLLLTLLNDLLDSAKVESGKLELETAPFSLRRMLDQIARVLAVRGSEKGLVFSCRVADAMPDAFVGDRMRLQQILLNLAGNAIKFTERGEVEVNVEQGAGSRADSPHPAPCSLLFTVRDTGIGISAEQCQRVFEPFAQGETFTSRRFGGTGLGLSIARNLVELMGGAIRVESEVGKGSKFYFTVQLPLSHEAPMEDELPSAVAVEATRPLRVLLVEDNPANQKLATYILRERGHFVEVAGGGDEAILLAQHNRYDAILMDVQMPGMSGLEATAAIRQRQSGNCRVPIIAMTAHALQDDRERCLAAGMDAYLSKPVNARELVGTLENLADQKAGSREQGARVSEHEATSLAPCCEPAAPSAATCVFDPHEALRRCCDRRDAVCDMIHYFLDSLEALTSAIDAALGRGDYVQVGEIGHRLKGSLAYLAADRATRAAARVERYCDTSPDAAEAEDAVRQLKQECQSLAVLLDDYLHAGVSGAA